MGRIKKWSQLAGGAGAILLATVGSAAAAGVDGGITFTNVATPANGITYARTATPSRLAVRRAIEAQSPIPTATFNAVSRPNSPMKPWGIPGIALFDYDNDGDLDIYVTNGPGTPNSLYKNMLKETGKLTFVDVAVQAGVDATAQDSSAVCFGDIDNDGNDEPLRPGRRRSEHPLPQQRQRHLLRHHRQGRRRRRPRPQPLRLLDG